ncbi:type VI secretion system baseplate subunit TssK [Paraburkholderia humisilvae]|uniref:Type VI secretion system baseplate subunit TssK n=1 Tax=Paraburkholderia humisilvae TaxID=627669 RepID=A0A6J5EYW0_9BURK|nr:type VI secretion system baseplate subunit TssK [Paraburkholderia humisilvae]CAB3770195.1 hypothetical protein LMG29542_06296 [Paraburkholderia humisilvae]
MNRFNGFPEVPYGIQWSEGLMLSPQHLQQNERFWQAHMRYLITRANPDYWGVHSLEVDEGQLERGRVVVRSIACVLDDGTPVVLDRLTDAALELDVATDMQDAGSRRRIALVLPTRGDAAAAPGTMNRRFESVAGGSAVDENTGANPVPIARLRPAYRLATGWVPGANLLCGCPLFELERTALGTFRRTPYHPPLTSIAVSGFMKDKALNTRVEAMRDALHMKLRQIAQSAANASTRGADGDSFLTLAARRMSTVLPALDVLALGTDVAPRQLYLALAQTVGALASLDTPPDPPMLPPYDHLDCQPGFDAALTFIEMRLAAIRPMYERLPFEQVGAGEFSRVLPADADGTLLIEVMPAVAQSRTDLEHWFENCTIAQPALLAQLEQRRIPGATAAPVPAVGRHEGLNPAALYYEIRNGAFEFDGAMQSMFVPGQPLTIRGGGRFAGAHAPAAIVLYRAPNRTAPTPRAGGAGHAAEPASTARAQGAVREERGLDAAQPPVKPDGAEHSDGALDH